MECPDELTLARFALRELSVANDHAITNHIATCPNCRALISVMFTASQHEPAAEPPCTDTVPRLTSGQSFGKFVITERLGEGAASVVYAAYDPQLDRPVALKLLRSHNPTHDARWQREGRALAAVTHANLVTVYEVAKVGSQPYIALELVEGVTLRQWTALAPRTWQAVSQIYVAAAEGLAALHAQHLVHQDVKPDNIVVSAKQAVRVIDFGLVGAGVGTGTPRYMSPEVAAGQACEPRDDQYSLAIAMRESLSQRGGVPWPLRRILAKASAPTREARYASILHFARDLAAAPSRLRTWGLAGATLAAATSGYVALAPSSTPAIACDTPAVPWSTTAMAHVRQRFATSNLPYAADALAQVTQRFDGFGQGWQASARTACHAYATLGTLAVVDFRNHAACQASQARTAHAVLAALREAPLARAATILHSLPDANACDDVARLRRTAPLPEALLPRTRVLALEASLLRATLAYTNGQDTWALATVRAIIKLAALDGYAPLMANTKFQLARFLVQRGQLDEAVPLLHEAIALAAAAKADAIEASAWNSLIATLSNKHDATDREINNAQMAALAAAARAGVPRARAVTLTSMGRLATRRLRYAEARPHFEQAIALLRGLDDKRAINAALLGLSDVLPALGDNAGGLRAAQEAVTIDREHWGAHHPEFASSLTYLASREIQMGEVAAAAQHFAEALAIYTAQPGYDESATVALHINYAAATLELGRFDEARRLANHALRVAERYFAKPNQANDYAIYALAMLGAIEHGSGQLTAARSYSERTLTALRGTLGEHNAVAGQVMTNLADTLLAQGDAQQCVRISYKAILAHRATAESQAAGEAHTMHGRCLLALDRTPGALVALERGYAIQAAVANPSALALAEFHLATAHWAQGNHTRAGELLQAASQRLARMGVSGAKHLHLLTTWAKAHHLTLPTASELT